MASSEPGAATPLLDPSREAGLYDAAAYATRFFMDDADVHHALAKLARLLDEAKIPTPWPELWRWASTAIDE